MKLSSINGFIAALYKQGMCEMDTVELVSTKDSSLIQLTNINPTSIEALNTLVQKYGLHMQINTGPRGFIVGFYGSD